MIATSGNDGVKTWSWRDNKLFSRDYFDEESGACCLRFNHNGQVLVSAGENGVITLRHSSGQKLGQLIDKSPPTVNIDNSYNHNNNPENMYGNNSGVREQQQQDSKNLQPQINAVSFSSGSRYLACGGTDKIVKVWDLKKRSIIRNFKTHTASVTCVEFSRDGDKYIGSGSANGEIILYNVVTGKLALTLSSSANNSGIDLNNSLNNSQSGRFNSIRNAITSLSFSNLDRRLLASSNSDGSVCIWDITESSTRALREGYGGLHSAPTSEVSFSPVNPSIFASVGYDKRLVLVDHESGGNVVSEIHVRSPLTCCCFLPGGQQIAVGTTDGGFLSYDLRRMGSGAASTPLIDVDIHAPVEVSCIEAQPATAMIASQLTSSQNRLQQRRKKETTPVIVNREKPEKQQSDINRKQQMPTPAKRPSLLEEPTARKDKLEDLQKTTYSEEVPEAPSTASTTLNRNKFTPPTHNSDSDTTLVSKNRKVTFAATTTTAAPLTTKNFNSNDFNQISTTLVNDDEKKEEEEPVAFMPKSTNSSTNVKKEIVTQCSPLCLLRLK